MVCIESIDGPHLGVTVPRRDLQPRTLEVSFPVLPKRPQPSCSSNALRPPSFLKPMSHDLSPNGLSSTLLSPPVSRRNDVRGAWSERTARSRYNLETQGTHPALDTPTSLMMSYCDRSWSSRRRGRALPNIRNSLVVFHTTRIHHFGGSYSVPHNIPSLATRGRSEPISAKTHNGCDFERGRHANPKN